MKITLDTSQIRALSSQLEKFSSQARAVALTRGLAKTAKQGAVAAKREIVAQYNIKAGKVAERISVVSRRNDLSAEIKARPRNARSNRIPLMLFGARGTKRRGVTYSVRRGTKTRLKHAFIATMPNGKQGVFERVGNTRRIKEVVGIDVTHMMVGNRVLPAVMAKINEALLRTVTHEMRYELQRRGFR